MEKVKRNQGGLQNLIIDYSTDTRGRILSMSYNEIGDYNGELFYTFDSFGNTSALTDQGNVIVGYLYDLNNGAIKSEYNPQGIDNPYKGGGKERTLSLKPWGPIVFDIPERGMWALRERFISVYIGDWGAFAVAGNSFQVSPQPFLGMLCECEWLKGKGKFTENDRNTIKKTLRNKVEKEGKTVSEAELDKAVDALEKDMNDCCNENGNYKGHHGYITIGSGGGVVAFGIDCGLSVKGGYFNIILSRYILG